jgi:hypothetical protein
MPTAAELLGRQQVPWGGGAGHEHDRGQAVAVGDGAAPAAVGWAGWRWQQWFDDRPQVVGGELVDEAGHGAGSCRAPPRRERSDVLLVGGPTTTGAGTWRRRTSVIEVDRRERCCGT